MMLRRIKDKNRGSKNSFINKNLFIEIKSILALCYESRFRDKTPSFCCIEWTMSINGKRK